MQKIQLYIDNQRVELFGDETVTVNESIRNAKDVGKVFTTFTQQFSVPASKINNKIFKHYYNYNIVGGFDARKKINAKIEINHIPFRDGKLKLDGVDMRSNSPYAYRVTFYGSVVELKDILGEDKLPSLTIGDDGLDIDKDYSSAALKSALTSPVDADGCIVPLITHSQRLYYDSSKSSQSSGNLYYDGVTEQGLKYTQLKYAVKLRRIIEAIESKYTTDNGYASNISFDTTSFFKDDTKDFKDLYMWCHRKNGAVEVLASNEISYGFASITGDGQGSLSGGAYVVNEDIDLPLREVTINTTMNSSSVSSKYNLIIKVNDVVYKRYDEQVGDISKIVPIDGIEDGDLVKVFVQTYEDAVFFDDMNMVFEYEIQSQVGGSVIDTADALFYNIPSSFKFNIADNLPDMKVIDFLSSLFKMFNLVAFVSTGGKIQVKTLDEFYTTVNKDITKYIDVEKSAVDAALPYSEIFFKYKDTKTILAEQHLQEIADPPVEWGGEEYKDTSNLSGQIYKVEPDFHHCKYEKLLDVSDTSIDTKLQVGYFVNDNEESYLGSPLILYVNSNLPASVSISYTGVNGLEEITTASNINMPSNLSDIDNPLSTNIHFGVERSEYDAQVGVPATEATETLFKRFYQSYIENVFNVSSRIIKVSAVLPIGFMTQLKLSDVVIIAQQKFRINSYTMNLNTGRTSLELINYYD